MPQNDDFQQSRNRLSIEEVPLPAVLSIEDAIKSNSFHPNTERCLSKGDVNTCFLSRQCNKIIEGEVHVGGQEHFYLETQSTLIWTTDGANEVHMISSTQKKAPSAYVDIDMFCCSASLALSNSESGPQSKSGDDSGLVVQYKGDDSLPVTQLKNVGYNSRAAEEERFLISEVLVRNKEGEELERKDLEAEAVNALIASRANAALTSRDVQEDVHRTGLSPVDTSCLVFRLLWILGMAFSWFLRVEPNQEFQGLVCEGANVLPSKFIEDAFRDGYVFLMLASVVIVPSHTGEVVNIRRLDEVISKVVKSTSRARVPWN
ncbi:Outer envelope protein 80, chloroplastic [Orobanche gracilis]